jgi:hypothetical protein
MPAVSYPNGQGKIVHPTLGAFDYEYPPDEWTNMDGDVMIAPTYASTKSLQGSSSKLWSGDIRDITCEERWLSLGGLAMPITQLRLLLACFMNPVDPSIGYMQWYPSYSNAIGYNVQMIDVVTGNAGSPVMAAMAGFKSQGIALNDLINSLDGDGNPFGWTDKPVSVFWKMVSKVQV